MAFPSHPGEERPAPRGRAQGGRAGHPHPRPRPLRGPPRGGGGRQGGPGAPARPHPAPDRLLDDAGHPRLRGRRARLAPGEGHEARARHQHPRPPGAPGEGRVLPARLRRLDDGEGAGRDLGAGEEGVEGPAEGRGGREGLGPGGPAARRQPERREDPALAEAGGATRASWSPRRRRSSSSPRASRTTSRSRAPSSSTSRTRPATSSATPATRRSTCSSPAAGSAPRRRRARGSTWRTTRCPPDFAKIPDDSAKENVKAAVAGTPQAKEALIANLIPQTAEVKVADAKMDPPKYDGEPKLVPIEGTPLHYVVNTATPDHPGQPDVLVRGRERGLVHLGGRGRALGRRHLGAVRHLHHPADLARPLRDLRAGLPDDADDGHRRLHARLLRHRRLERHGRLRHRLRLSRRTSARPSGTGRPSPTAPASGSPTRRGPDGPTASAWAGAGAR